MAKLPTADDWSKDPAVINAGVKGFNALSEVPRMLYEHIPRLRDYKFMFCSESDLPEALSMDWRFMDTEMFDADEWNKAMPLRFGISTVDGHIKYRENWILIQHKEYREIVERLRNEAADNQLAHAVNTSGQVHPEDPQAKKMKEYADELTTMDIHRVQGGGSEPERKE